MVYRRNQGLDPSLAESVVLEHSLKKTRLRLHLVHLADMGRSVLRPYVESPS
jgi:hypothetical protein